MTTDVALPAELVNPLSGELVNTQDMPAVAQTLEALREHRQRVNDAIAAFTEAVVAESVRQGTRTLTAGGLRLEVSAASEVEWDLDVLSGLAAAGLPDARFTELVSPTVTYKVDGSVARQLAGSNAEYARIIERAKIRVPKRQYVSVKP